MKNYSIQEILDNIRQIDQENSVISTKKKLIDDFLFEQFSNTDFQTEEEIAQFHDLIIKILEKTPYVKIPQTTLRKFVFHAFEKDVNLDIDFNKIYKKNLNILNDFFITFFTYKINDTKNTHRWYEIFLNMGVTKLDEFTLFCIDKLNKNNPQRALEILEQFLDNIEIKMLDDIKNSTLYLQEFEKLEEKSKREIFSFFNVLTGDLDTSKAEKILNSFNLFDKKWPGYQEYMTVCFFYFAQKRTPITTFNLLLELYPQFFDLEIKSAMQNFALSRFQNTKYHFTFNSLATPFLKNNNNFLKLLNTEDDFLNYLNNPYMAELKQNFLNQIIPEHIFLNHTKNIFNLLEANKQAQIVDKIFNKKIIYLDSLSINKSIILRKNAFEILNQSSTDPFLLEKETIALLSDENKTKYIDYLFSSPSPQDILHIVFSFPKDFLQDFFQNNPKEIYQDFLNPTAQIIFEKEYLKFTLETEQEQEIKNTTTFKI